MHILVTGFEPFEGVPSNPTMRILNALPGVIDDVRIERVVLPVDTRGAPEALAPLWAAGPAAVVHLGVAAERTCLSLEERAENRLRFPVNDNRGLRVEDEPIEVGGPTFLPSRLPLNTIAEAIGRVRVTWERSASAGTFLCNQVMYASLRALPAATPTGFIHVPPDELLAEALGQPCRQPLADQVAGIRAALDALVRTPN
jgi:pyroglutamyl-peptidase